MVYFQSGALIIRDMTSTDVAIIAAGERAQGWVNAKEDKYLGRLRDAAAGKAVALAAQLNGQPAGYVNVYFQAEYGPFVGKGICEIVDFGVLEKYRRQGVGTALMNAAEAIAFERADSVCLGVGLHSGYGSAQRMYVKRGYVPDGSGVWYNDQPAKPYETCCNDDDLVLYLAKGKAME